MQEKQNHNEIDIPLCVDLDGTLIRSDVGYESLFALLKSSPLTALYLPLWALKGKPHLKRCISERVSLRADLLPYNQNLLRYLSSEKLRGRRLVLATASDRLLAEGVARHLGIFHDVVATDRGTNLSGRNKQRVLHERFTPGGFAYAGNAPVDYQVWEGAQGAIVVSRGAAFARAVKSRFPHALEFIDTPVTVHTVLRAMRAHQWLKNLLIFVPLVMAHRLNNPTQFIQALIAFAAFSLCASVVYLLNDLLDLEADREHLTKRNRPIASGELPIALATLLLPLLLLVAMTLAAFLPIMFSALLAGYFTITLLYSFYLKQLPMLDILVLAGLYTIRILAGGFAVDVPVSQWLLAFSMFFFLSLASVKRFSELVSVRGQEKKIAGRGYHPDDLEMVATLGAASGYISVLVLALYTSGQEVTALYSHPKFLWLICPLMLYWISRVWLLAHRGELDQDPIVFAIKDRVSYLIGALAALVMLFAV